MSRVGHGFGRWLFAPAVAAGLALGAAGAYAADGDWLPEIRTSTINRVPACVTPDRLMAFVAARNQRLPAKFSNIASVYRDVGEATQVRWDYAFFQMILETNYLMYRRGDGSSGDVGQTQNNFAGIGATGGGVPGDRYGDVRTGVLAHMQHLVAYSGERVERPVATRTREYQNDIIEISRKLGRRVTFSDLSRRWAVDRAYARNIETVAQLFRRAHCSQTAAATPAGRTGFAAPSRLGAGAVEAPPAAEGKPTGSALVSTVWRRGEEAEVPAPKPAVPRPVAAVPRAKELPASTPDTAADLGTPQPAGDAVPAVSPAVPRQAQRPGAARFALAAEAGVAAGALPVQVQCRVYSASYGGTESVLIRSRSGNEMRLTAVVVATGEGRSLAQTFIAQHAPGGEIIGHYDSKEAAVSAARGICRAI